MKLRHPAPFSQVLVLDAGAVAEFGPPRELAAREGGAFAQLVRGRGARAPPPLPELSGEARGCAIVCSGGGCLG